LDALDKPTGTLLDDFSLFEANGLCIFPNEEWSEMIPGLYHIAAIQNIADLMLHHVLDGLPGGPQKTAGIEVSRM